MVSCGDSCCSTDNGNCGSTAENVYSTEETVCGKWIDGKPIYRKVIPGKLAIDSGDSLVFANVSELKIDRVINLYGNMSDKLNAYQVVLQASYNREKYLSAAANMFYCNATGIIEYHYFSNNGQYSGGTAYVIIEYTKK